MGNIVPERADLKVRTTVSRSAEPNEEAIGNWNQSKRNKHEAEQSSNNDRRKQSNLLLLILC